MAETINLSEKSKDCEKTNRPGNSNQKLQERDASTGRKLLIMAACLFLHIIAGGIATSLGVIYVDLIRVFNAPHSQAALVQSLFEGTLVAGGVVFTSVLQKYGNGIPVMISSMLAGIAFFASSFAPNVPTLIVLIGVIAGISLSINFLSAYIMTGWTFQENTKTVLAILTMGWITGQISFPYISEYLVNEFSWNGSLVILSGLLFNCIPCGLLFYTSKHYFFMETPAKTTFREALTGCVKDYIFVIYLTAFFLYLFMALVEMWFIADLAIVKGFDRSVGTFLLSLIGIAGSAGRISGILFLHMFKIQALVHFSYSIMMYGVAHYLVGYFDQLPGLIFAMGLRGFFTGISGAVIPGTMIEVHGIEKFPQTVALCNLIGGVSQTVGGLLGGATVDLTGGYDFIFTFAAVDFFVCSILILIVWILKKRQTHLAPLVGNHYKTDEETANEKSPIISKQG